MGNIKSYRLKKIINTTRRVSIYNRLAISFIVVILIPSLLIGYVSFSRSSKKIQSMTSRELYLIINRIDDGIRDRLKKYEELSFELCGNDKLLQLLKDCDTYYRIKEYMPEE